MCTQLPCHKPRIIGELMVQHQGDQLWGKGGKQEVFAGQERPPPASLYLPRAHLFPKGVLKCSPLPVSFAIYSFLLL